MIYELHVGSFNPPGTSRSVIDKLDHLKDLGINMIELMPVNQYTRPLDWGYSLAGPYAIHAGYGAPDDLKALIDAAHARGIGVLLDVVHNHYSDKNLLNCFDGSCTGVGGPYFYASRDRWTKFGPRPDYGQAEVRSFILDNVVELQSEFHLDGFRWDAVRYIRQFIDARSGDAGAVTEIDEGKNADGWSLLQEINQRLHQRETFQIAEDFDRGGFHPCRWPAEGWASI